MSSLTRELYQQVEAFVALSGQHTQEPLGSAFAVCDQNGAGDPVSLRTTPHGAASLASDTTAHLTKGTCDTQRSVRNTTQMTEFLKRAPEAIKTDDDRMQVLFVPT